MSVCHHPVVKTVVDSLPSHIGQLKHFDIQMIVINAIEARKLPRQFMSAPRYLYETMASILLCG